MQIQGTWSMCRRLNSLEPRKMKESFFDLTPPKWNNAWVSCPNHHWKRCYLLFANQYFTLSMFFDHIHNVSIFKWCRLLIYMLEKQLELTSQGQSLFMQTIEEIKLYLCNRIMCLKWKLEETWINIAQNIDSEQVVVCTDSSNFKASKWWMVGV